MTPSIVKPVADPLEDIDRVAPIDSLMARQDRADLPGNRSDEPQNGESPRATLDDETAAGADDEAGADPDDLGLSDDLDTLSLDDPDVALTIENTVGDRPGLGPDDDEPIEETERLGDDSRTV